MIFSLIGFYVYKISLEFNHSRTNSPSRNSEKYLSYSSVELNQLVIFMNLSGLSPFYLFN